MSIQNWRYHLCSEHSSMTNYLCFNETRDKFITCGQDGEVHVYFMINNKINKTGFANIFNEVIVAVSWGNAQAGGYVAVTGSKKGLAILKIDDKCGQIIIEKYFTMEETVDSLDWHPTSKRLICGTINGKVIWITCENGLWQIQQSANLSPNGNVQVAYGTSENQFELAGCQSIIYQMKRISKQRIQMKSSQLLKLNNNEIINKILVRGEGLVDFIEVLILTNKNLRIYEFNQGGLSLIQEIQVHKNAWTIQWGQSQSEIIIYLQSRHPEAGRGQSTLESIKLIPIIFRRGINGVWDQSK